MTVVTLSISEPVLEDVERLRKERGYENRSAWLEYLITRGLEVVRRESSQQLPSVSGQNEGVGSHGNVSTACAV